MPAPPFGTASAYTDSFPAPPPRELTVSAETCWNLGAFRDIMRQYRKLDDQIITRLNRAAAQLRDQSRLAGPSHAPDGPDGMCVRMWREMMWGEEMCSIEVWAQGLVVRDMQGGMKEGRKEGRKEAGKEARKAGIAMRVAEEAGWTHRQTLLTFCSATVNASQSSPGAGPSRLSGRDERLAGPAASSGSPGSTSLSGGGSGGEWRGGRGAKEQEVYINQLANEETIEAIIRKRSLDAFRSRCPYFSPAPSARVEREWWDLAQDGRKRAGPAAPA